jgi:WD40 repeat protein
MSRFPACLALAGLLGSLPSPSLPAQTTTLQAATSDRYGDPLPPGSVARLGTVRLRHRSPVGFVAFSPDGKALVSSTGDNSFLLWEIATGKRLHRIPGLLLGTSAAAFTPDGKTLVLLGEDRRVAVWDVATGKELRRLAAPSKNIQQAAVSPDGKTVALFDADQSLLLWDVAADKERHRLLGPADPKAGRPGFIPSALTFSADGKHLAAGGMQREGLLIRLWQVSGGRERPSRFVPTANFSYLVFSPDGKTLVVGNAQRGSVYLLDAATGVQIRRFAAVRTNGQPTASFSPDGKTLAVVNGVGVDLVDPATGQVLRRLPCPGQGFACLAFAPDGKTLAVGGADHIAHLWDLATGKEIRPPDGPRGPVAAIVYSPDGRTVASVGGDHTIRHWDPATGTELRCLRRVLNEKDAIELPPPLLAFHAGGTRLAAAWSDGVVHVWETATGRELARAGAPREGWRPLAFSPDGKALAGVGPDGLVRVFGVLGGRELRRFSGQPKGEQPAAPTAVRFAPDGRTLAASYSGQILAGLRGGTTPIPMSSPHGGTVRLWELTSGRARGQLSLGGNAGGGWIIDDGTAGTAFMGSLGQPTSVSALVFSPDSRTLAAVAGASVRLWNLEGNRELRRVESPFAGDAVAFSPDGRLLAVGAWAGFALLDVATGQELCQVRAHDGSITAVAFSPDGSQLISGASDTSALVWEVKRLLEAGRRQRAEPSPQRLEELWADLASADAPRAYRAVWSLAAAPGRSVPFLGTRLRAVPAVDGAKVARLLKELDHGRYAVRLQAARELEALGDLAEPALRAALEGKPSLERKRRVEPLLAKLEAPVTSPDPLRALRALEALERAGTAEARAVLARLAGGAPEARLTREARAALERLTRQGDSKP